VFYSDEDAAYIADVPDLEACSGFGSTAEEALAERDRAGGAAAPRELGGHGRPRLAGARERLRRLKERCEQRRESSERSAWRACFRFGV
jgi:hypothetical protein